MVEDLNEDVQAGKEFAHLDREQRQALLDAGRHVLQFIGPVERMADMTPEERQAVDLAIDDINHRVAEAELDRPKCQPERVTGSNRRVVVCRTAREQQAQRDAAMKALGKSRGCLGENCGRN
jgi:hypothetical protein